MTIEQDKIFPTTIFSTGNWIDEFVADTPATESPILFRKWCAIATLSGLAQRRIWCDIGKGALFPNQFILLVSPPGVGKSVVLKMVEQVWALNKSIFIGDETTTIPGLLDYMQDCEATVSYSGIVEQTHPVSVACREYGTYMKSYDLSALNLLNDFWDCPKSFSEMTRGGGKNELSYPVMNLVSGTQPSYLNNVLPEEAWSLGFCSRLILVYDWQVKQLKTRERLALPKFNPEKYRPAVDAICKWQGQLSLSDEALDLFDSWIVDQGMKPLPMHPRLASYIARRPVHWLKVAMCYALAFGSTKITLQHLQLAKDTLLEVEESMPNIFRDMSKQSDKDVLDEIRMSIIRMALKEPQIPERKLIQLLTSKIATHRVNYFLDVMEASGYISECEAPKGMLTQWGNRGFRFFKPGIDLNKGI